MLCIIIKQNLRNQPRSRTETLAAVAKPQQVPVVLQRHAHPGFYGTVTVTTYSSLYFYHKHSSSKFISKFLPIFELHTIKGIICTPLGLGRAFFTQHYVQDSFTLLHLVILHSFFVTSDIPPCDCVTFIYPSHC